MDSFQNTLLYPVRAVRVILLCLLLGLSWNQVLYGETAANTSQDNEIELVWSGDLGHGEQVYFSRYEKNSWTSPVQLSDSSDMVYHSAVSSGDDGRTWAVWTRQDKKKKFLEFTVNSGSKWTKPRVIKTELDSNKEVTVIVDRNNTPLIAWTGIDKIYSDVFWSRWNGKVWSSPEKVHADNDVPDVKPGLSLDGSGRVVLSWQTFSNGCYVTVSKIWDGEQWQRDSMNPGNKEPKNTLRQRTRIPAIPDFITERRNATLFIKGAEGAESVPLSGL